MLTVTLCLIMALTTLYRWRSTILPQLNILRYMEQKEFGEWCFSSSSLNKAHTNTAVAIGAILYEKRQLRVLKWGKNDFVGESKAWLEVQIPPCRFANCRKIKIGSSTTRILACYPNFFTPISALGSLSTLACYHVGSCLQMSNVNWFAGCFFSYFKWDFV